MNAPRPHSLQSLYPDLAGRLSVQARHARPTEVGS